MRRLLARVDANFEPIMIIVLFYSLLSLLTLQVFLRKFAHGGFPWAEEVCRFMFVWLVYFCISYATRNQRHIKVRFFVQLFNDKMQKFVGIMTDILFLIFSIVMFVSTLKLVRTTAFFGDKAISLDISMNFLYGAGLIGFLLMLIRIIQGIVWKIRNINEDLERFENVFGVYYSKNSLLPFLIENEDSEYPENRQEEGNIDK